MSFIKLQIRRRGLEGVSGHEVCLRESTNTSFRKNTVFSDLFTNKTLS